MGGSGAAPRVVVDRPLKVTVGAASQEELRTGSHDLVMSRSASQDADAHPNRPELHSHSASDDTLGAAPAAYVTDGVEVALVASASATMVLAVWAGMRRRCALGRRAAWQRVHKDDCDPGEEDAAEEADEGDDGGRRKRNSADSATCLPDD